MEKRLTFPDLFATSRGRLLGFFLLYSTEGVPLGFAATAVATMLRRQGVGPAEIGTFVASFYLPWAFKWAFGPLVDVFSSDRLGQRRGWILGTQLMMVLTLLSTALVHLPGQLGLFTAILLLHNVFAATQDVAIDALAVNTLQEHERATATGMMFAGASIGQMIGGSGALFVASVFGFESSVLFVAAVIFAVTLLVVLPMKEAARKSMSDLGSSRTAAARRELERFGTTAFRAFMGTRGAFVGLFLALLPPGAMCLGLALQSNLAVELGLTDDEVAWMGLASTLITALGSLLGGRIADRFDRRRSLTVYIVLMTIPVLILAASLQQSGWVMPVQPDAAVKPEVPRTLLIAFWAATLTYGLFNGMMYSASTAIYMDVTNPVVAATQFTAYMALCNLAIATSATWQGVAIEAVGYPATMLMDSGIGLLFLFLLTQLQVRSTASAWVDSIAPTRTRLLCLSLGVLGLAWLPVYAVQAYWGSTGDIIRLLFNLIAVASAMVLLAASVLLRTTRPRTSRVAMVGAGLPLGMLVIKFLASQAESRLAGLWAGGVELLSRVSLGLSWGAPLIAALLLLYLSRHDWDEVMG